METIASFKIDHTTLTKGLYVSRIDRVGLFSYATTFDVRMKTPYKDVPLFASSVHTLEHCLATYLRNERKDVLYVGPMGCLTGFYVILSGKRTTESIRQSLKRAFYWIQTIDTVPGATKKECGNYTFMNLKDAKTEAAAYLEVLSGL